MRSVSVNMSAGRPLKLLLRFALPLLIGNLFQQAYNLADSIIVGRFIGSHAVAKALREHFLSFDVDELVFQRRRTGVYDKHVHKSSPYCCVFCI